MRADGDDEEGLGGLVVFAAVGIGVVHTRDGQQAPARSHLGHPETAVGDQLIGPGRVHQEQPARRLAVAELGWIGQRRTRDIDAAGRWLQVVLMQSGFGVQGGVFLEPTREQEGGAPVRILVVAAARRRRPGIPREPFRQLPVVGRADRRLDRQ